MSELTGNNLTPKQQMFAVEYLVDLNATKAAIRAGYSEDSARAIGSENLTKPDIQKAIAEAMEHRAKRVQVNADYVISNIKSTVERCSQAEPVLDKEGERTGEYRFEANAVLKGCELLGRHLKMFTDKLETSGELRVKLQNMSDEELEQSLKEHLDELGYSVEKKK